MIVSRRCKSVGSSVRAKLVHVPVLTWMHGVGCAFEALVQKAHDAPEFMDEYQVQVGLTRLTAKPFQTSSEALRERFGTPPASR